MQIKINSNFVFVLEMTGNIKSYSTVMTGNIKSDSTVHFIFIFPRFADLSVRLKYKTMHVYNPDIKVSTLSDFKANSYVHYIFRLDNLTSL